MDYNLEIDGMSCNGCVKNVTKMIQEFDNIKNVSVDLENHSAKISTKNQLDTNAILKRFEGTKFSIKNLTEQQNEKASIFSKIKNIL